MKAVPSRSFGPPSVLPDISPTGGEIRLSLQLSPIPNVAERAPAAK
ncbi:MAG: ABC transporter ATP-binding protein, partial [Mesorhizobium sp.]